MAELYVGKPNTNEPAENGATPGSLIYSYTKRRRICTSCNARWCEEGLLKCARCESREHAWRQRSQRKKDPKRKKDPNPQQLTITITRSLRGDRWVVDLNSDIGKLLSVSGLITVDINDASAGKAKITMYRSEQATQEKTKK